MNKKLNPLQMVAKEIADHSTLTKEQIEESLKAVLNHLNERTATAIKSDIDSVESFDFAKQYQAVSETILYLGSQLIAFEEIESMDDLDDELKN
jgi:hypothetical protein